DLDRLQIFLRQLFRNRLALAGAVIILVFFAMSIFAPLIAGPYPTPVQGAVTLDPPSNAHILGTDYHGRDIFPLLVSGGRLALLIQSSASADARTLDLFNGLISGFYRL